VLIRPVSDIHLEFNHKLSLPVLPEDEETVLVVAGDLSTAARSKEAFDWLRRHKEQFRHIIYIMGNHEYYDGHFKNTLADFQKLNEAGISIVDQATVIVDDVKFICATLWTDMSRHNPIVMGQCQRGMSDYHYTVVDDTNNPHPAGWFWHRRMDPEDTYQEHILSRNFIKRELERNEYKHVVVTHHLPSYQCVSDRYKTGPLMYLNPAFASDMDDLFYDYKIALWIHGHTHTSSDILIGDTMVVGNPFGYADVEVNLEFDSCMRKEV
jgi:predicted phosphohydrolase